MKGREDNDMVRDFNDADRARKRARIGGGKDSSASGASDTQPALEERVKAGLQQGYLPCPTAFGIARKLGVSLTAVGDAADRLGVRISNCQLGCFKVDKNLHEDLSTKTIKQKAIEAVAGFTAENPLTCLGAFQLAKRIGVKPIDVADAANARHVKIHSCQLGCW